MSLFGGRYGQRNPTQKRADFIGSASLQAQRGSANAVLICRQSSTIDQKRGNPSKSENPHHFDQSVRDRTIRSCVTKPPNQITTEKTMKTKRIPQNIQKILDEMPARGAGLNRWLFKAAIHLLKSKTPDEVTFIIGDRTKNEPIKPGEIERAVVRAGEAIEGKLLTGKSEMKKWPDTNYDRRREIIGKGGNLEMLRKANPKTHVPIDLSPASVITKLFSGNPLICCGTTIAAARTRPLSEWIQSLPQQQFIVPSPMRALTGMTQDGKISRRCLDNTGYRRYMVVEQDEGSIDEQAAIILHLANIWPLTLVVHSGGKSLHAWFCCEDSSEDKQGLFMRLAVYFGADPATWTKCQLVRMPGGLRDNGNRQEIVFFNPYAIR